MKIPFAPPYISPATLPALAEVLESGWITTGAKTKELERKLAEILGISTVLCLNSATAGMELVLRQWGIGVGDEVIVPAYTYCATANIVLHCGATPVMADIDETDFTISVAAIEKLITPKTKAVICVDIGGMPCKYTEIQAVLEAQKHKFQPNHPYQAQLGKILLLSDAAHSLGAIYKGKAAVHATDISVYSFHAVKNLTTAEGGAIAWNLPENFSETSLYQEANILSLHGQNKDALAKLQLNAWEYDVEVAGYKWNMPDLLAVLGLVGLSEYPQILQKRKQICKTYQAHLQIDTRFICPLLKTEERESSYHLYLLRLTNATLAQRNALINALAQQNIATNVHYKPLPLLTLYRKLGYKMEDYPVAYRAYEQEISLPVFYNLSEEQIAYLLKNLKTLISF